MKHIKTFEGKSFLNIYYKLIEDLDVGDYVAIDASVDINNLFFENEIGEIMNISDSHVYIFFKKSNITTWVKKEYIIKNSKLKKDIEEFIEIKKDSKKYNI